MSDVSSDTTITTSTEADGISVKATTVSSDRSFFGALFASGDMSVDSIIVMMAASVVAFWLIVGYQVVAGKETSSPLALGGGFAAMLAAFAGGKTARDRWSGNGDPSGSR